MRYKNYKTENIYSYNIHIHFKIHIITSMRPYKNLQRKKTKASQKAKIIYAYSIRQIWNWKI